MSITNLGYLFPFASHPEKEENRAFSSFDGVRRPLSQTDLCNVGVGDDDRANLLFQLF